MAMQRDIIEYVEDLAGHKLNDDEGPLWGEVQQEVRGVTVCWMADPNAIAAAGQKGHNLIITHEALTYPYPGMTKDEQRHYLAWNINGQRLGLLSKYDIAVCRMHGTLDELFIFDAFAEQLGLQKVVAQAGRYCDKIFSIEPMRYADLIKKVKADTGMKGLRVTPGDPNRLVEVVGVPWGGMGLFVNVSYMQALIELGAVDVMICGETDNYGIRFCEELGIDVIETSHEVSENRGLRKFTDTLRAKFERLEISFYENPPVWTIG